MSSTQAKRNIREHYDPKQWNLLREELMRRHDMVCYWCGRTTVFWKKQSYIPTPENFATIDHLYSRLDARRAEYPFFFVLACWTCNHRRGEEACFFTPHKAKWIQSKTGLFPHLSVEQLGAEYDLRQVHKATKIAVREAKRERRQLKLRARQALRLQG